MRRRDFLLGVLALGGVARAAAPSGWTRVGKVEGLLGEDWSTRKSANTLSYCRAADIPYMDSVAAGLEKSFAANRDFMGYVPSQLLPLEFYFCPMDQPAFQQPKFARRLAGKTRFAGIALGGTNMCCCNMGDARLSRTYAPWEVDETCRHEMNHLFAFPRFDGDRGPNVHWWLEAMAHTVENTVKPRESQLTPTVMKEYMRGYKAVDANFQALIGDRDNDQLEQYRDYEKLLISVVFYLQEKFGRGAVAKIMAQQAVTGNLEQSFVGALGLSSTQMEQGWRTFYGIR